MFDPVQTPPEPHYPPKTKFEFQNSIFKKIKNQFLKSKIFIIQIFKMLTIVIPGKRQLKHA